MLFENVLSLAADYISWYVAAHAALTSQTARERLGHVLAELAPTIGQNKKDGVELDVTNEELANSANITPYTTSRLIRGRDPVQSENTKASFFCSRWTNFSFTSFDVEYGGHANR